jgi:chromosome segregation ATPase
MALKARAHESNLRSGGDKREERLVLHPVDLSTLVEPFRGNGKLSLRFEGLPPRARFSNGNRASERAWSLTPEDLPGLSYVLAPDTDIDHALTLRVVGLERGDTLGVQTVRMKDVLGAATPPSPSAKPDRGSDDLRAHLDESKKSLSSLENQLADALKVIQKLSEPSGRDAGADLETARAQWKADEAERLASFQAQWREAETTRFNDLNAQWQAKLQELVSRHLEEVATAKAQNNSSELKVLRDKVAALQSTIDERETALGTAMKRFEAEKEERSLEQSAARSREAKLKQTLADLESEHTRALKAADEQLRLQAKASGNEGEAIRQLNDTVRHLQSTLVERDRALAELTRLVEQKDSVQRQLQTDAASAATNLEALKQTQTLELARLQEELSSARASGKDEQIAGQLNEKVRHLQTTLSERERTLAEMTRVLEQKEAAQASLQEELRAVRAATPSPAPKAEGGEELKDAIKTLQRTLAEREQALSRIVRELDQERSNRETMELEARHLHEKLDSAEHTFAREHARVLSEAETNWQKQFAVELEQMKARAEAAESASAEVRKRMQDMARLEGEVNHLRATLTEREAALQSEQDRLSRLSESLQTRESEVQAQVRGNRPARAMVREALIGVACTVATIIIVPALGFWNPPPQVLKVEVPAVASASGTQAVPVHGATVLRTTRLRVGPGANERALVRAERGVEVTVVESRDGWLRVRMNHKTRVVEGWVDAAAVDQGAFGAAASTTPIGR